MLLVKTDDNMLAVAFNYYKTYRSLNNINLRPVLEIICL